MISRANWAGRIPFIGHKAAMEPGSPVVFEQRVEVTSGQLQPPHDAPSRPMLALSGITKRFQDVVANDAINLDIYGGEVHAILGENGAGKSTLMKIIYGVYQPDAGTIQLEGNDAQIQSPRDSRRMGIGMVFQNFALIPALTVAENVALFLPQQGMILSRRALAQQIRSVSGKYDLQVDPTARVSDLSMGERQKVELIKLIMANARVLILDEPTSVLAPHEVDGLFRVFEELKRDGFAILFITHKIREVLASADRITVLRHGAVVSTQSNEGVSAESLVSMMLGVETPTVVRNTSSPSNTGQAAAIEFRDLWTSGVDDPRGLHGVSFRVMPGEILGVAGVSGNGQEELGEALLGMVRVRSGGIFLSGRNVSGWPVSRILDAGVSYVPEDPISMAMVPEMRVDENLVLGELQNYGNGGIWLDLAGIRRKIKEMLAAFSLEIAPQEARVDQLSGGNVQRVILARELGLTREVASAPKVLMAYYPTRGLDVLTAETTRGLMMNCREKGGAIVLVSEDLDELFALCDRMVVMYQGGIVGEFRPKDASIQEIGLLMTGNQK